MSKDNQGGLSSLGLPRTPLGKKVSDLEKLIVWTIAESWAEEDNGSDHRPLSVENEGEIPTASTAVDREDDDAILSTNQDHLFKTPSSTNLLRRGDLLQPPITGPVCPIPKMNIPVMDQHQHWPMNKPPQLLDTYHRLYWDNEQVLTFLVDLEDEFQKDTPDEVKLEALTRLSRDLVKELAEESTTYREAQDKVLNYCAPDCDLDMFKIDLLDIKQEPDEAATEFLEK
uniref:Uncharacterized protein n=1 Tax=Romanomermis culicivorax TaxID=13658 RepID=A0A915JF83_ROMCU